MKKVALIFIALTLSVFAFSQDNKKAVDTDRGYVVKVGDKAPDFTIRYLDGTTTTLSKLRGKVVMLQFTASWCGVCRKEMPHIESDIWLKHKNNKNFALLGIDLKENAEAIKEFAVKTKVTYPLVLDELGEVFEKFAKKGAGVTRNIVINRKGEIVFLTRLFDNKEFDEMKAVIEKELKKK